jgi:DNA-binding LacI/PurR family transcriptional regulator
MGTFPIRASIIGGSQMSRAAPTIHDVAELAGVSKSVVSRVLRGNGSVSAASRDAVMRAARSLGYRPNAVARSLVQGRTSNVGVLVSDLHNVFFAEILDGIDAVAGGAGYRMLIVTGNRDADAEAAALETLLQLRTDGVILVGPRLPAEVVSGAGRQVPLAVVGNPRRVPRADGIVNDDVRGAELAVEHLAALGHTRIAMIDGANGAGAAERRAGYEAAMRRLGLGDRIRVAAGDFTEDGGYGGALRLLEGSPPTAILASNDQAAVGALTALEEAGLDVPRDISLVGYDNTALASLRQISLTTIDQPRRQLGEMAMKAVLRRIERPDARTRRLVLEPELVVRATTGSPPSRDG